MTNYNKEQVDRKRLLELLSIIATGEKEDKNKATWQLYEILVGEISATIRYTVKGKQDYVYEDYVYSSFERIIANARYFSDGKFNEKTIFGAIKTTVKYHVLNLLKKERKMVFMDEQSLENCSGKYEIEDEIAFESEIEQVKNIVEEKLSEAQKRLYVDYFGKRHTYQEIANELDVAVATVAYRVKKILQIVKDELEKHANDEAAVDKKQPKDINPKNKNIKNKGQKDEKEDDDLSDSTDNRLS